LALNIAASTSNLSVSTCDLLFLHCKTYAIVIGLLKATYLLTYLSTFYTKSCNQLQYADDYVVATAPSTTVADTLLPHMYVLVDMNASTEK